MKSVGINIDSETETLGPREVGRDLLSGKLEQNIIEEDLEELKENKVQWQKKQEYNELNCHMCSEIFSNVESLGNQVRKSYSVFSKLKQEFFY